MRKIRILEQQGFTKSPLVIATVQEKFPEKPKDRFRTKCFMDEKMRVQAHKALARKNRSTSRRESQDSLQAYDGAELYCDEFKV